MKEELDFLKMVSEDDIRDIEDNIKGVIVLLHGLVFADETGVHKYQKQAYNTLADSLDKTLEKLEVIKGGVYYMQDIIRVKNE